MQQIAAGPARLQRHAQRVQAQFGPQVIGHAPADDPAAAQVHHRRQVQQSFVGRDVGDVAAPLLVGQIRLEIAVQQIGRHRLIVIGVGGLHHEPAMHDRADLGLFHELATVFTQTLMPCSASSSAMRGLP